MGLTLFFIAWFLIKHREEKIRFAVNRKEFASVRCAGWVVTDGIISLRRKQEIISGVPRGGLGVLGVSNPPSEIPKALQNRAKLNPIVKTVKNC